MTFNNNCSLVRYVEPQSTDEFLSRFVEKQKKSIDPAEDSLEQKSRMEDTSISIINEAVNTIKRKNPWIENPCKIALRSIMKLTLPDDTPSLTPASQFMAMQAQLIANLIKEFQKTTDLKNKTDLFK